MLTNEEEKFIQYWNLNREKQKRIATQLYIGLPAGLVLGLPILLNIFLDWNTQIKYMTRGELNTILVAVLIIITFIAIFTVKHKWDMQEQLYKELLYKKKKQNI